MPKPTLDDFEMDFEGALSALADEVLKEIQAIPEDQRSDFFTARRAARLARMIEIRAPDIIIEREEKILARDLRARAKARRQDALVKST